MNLVQINERLKDLPMQVIQQYANGMNPEVPPYLALGELQRRETAQKQMSTAQGGMQGPQPSIKEQVEQKAGLMAAQGLQQQQAMQQMAQQRAPGPVPAGTPQPEMQPEAAMARGGLTRAPVNFNFQHGGIVAFANGGDVDPRRERKEGESFADFRKRMFELDLQLQREKNAAQESGRESERQRRLAERGNEVIPPSPFLDREPLPVPAASGMPATSNRGLMNKVEAAMPAPPAASPTAPIADLKALAEQKQRQQPPRAMPAASAAPIAAPARTDPNSMEAMLMAQLGKGTKESTLAEQLAEQKAAREGAGMTGAAGQDQMARIKAMQQQYESTKPDGLDDLIRVFGQAGQYKGLTGTGPAYTANQDRKRAADLNMAAKINEMMSGVETTQRGEQKEVASGALSGLGANRTAIAGEGKDKLSALMTGRNTDVQASTQRRGQDMQLQAAKIQAAASQAAREMGADEKVISAAEAAYARDPEVKVLKDAMEMLASTPENPKYQANLAKLRSIQASKYKQFGIDLQGGSGAAAIPLPANASASTLKVGTVYQTAKGPAKWTGSAFSPV